MADNTKIEWADATVNYINGCSVHSPGCTNCYAMKLAGTRLRNHPTREGLTVDSKAGPVWNGTVRNHDPALMQVLGWKRPRRIFWNAHGDTFHEVVPDEWIDRMFAVCALTPQHTHMILTKRSERMREYLSAFIRGERGVLDAARNLGRLDDACDALSDAAKKYPACVSVGPLPNVWLGVSVEDQARANERIPDLLTTPAAVRFISAEPLLGPVDLDCPDVDWARYPAGQGLEPLPPEGRGRLLIDWVIVGGESGPGARPMHPAWVSSLRDQCADADVPFFFKQWGEWAPVEMVADPCGLPVADLMPDGLRVVHPNIRTASLVRVGKKAAGRLLDGVEHNGFPAVRHG